MARCREKAAQTQSRSDTGFSAASDFVPAPDLIQINSTLADAILAGEKHAHALTKVALIEAAARAQLAEARAHVAALFADKNAAEQRHKSLTADVKKTHNLTDKHAIDPLTGVVQPLE